MAIIYPPYERIKSLKVPPTEGELKLVDFLLNNLNDEYEIFFQPFLNGDCPDIILMRKGGGVLIIEVKDWNLESYHLDFKKQWFISSNNRLIKSPIKQVLKYKENIYDLHIENLLELKLKDYRYWYVVNCAVFFSNATSNELMNLLLTPFELRKEFVARKKNNDPKFNDTKANIDIESSKDKYLTFLHTNIEIIGQDTLSSAYFDDILNRKWISRKSMYFTDDLYNSFKRYLQPSFHSLDDGKDFHFKKKQLDFSESKSGVYKIRGIAGSGKTLVLAKRAVNAHKRTGGDVLILAYNIAIKNYIHDKISNVRDEFHWGHFHINTYHEFINSNLNNLGIAFDFPENFDTWNSAQKEAFFKINYYNNFTLFEEHTDRLPKYDAILIDEVQDYETMWLRIIKKYFLIENGEFVVFGDSKQDIYNRVGLIDKKKELVIPNSPGGWGVLNESFRLPPSITSFALSFQNKYLSEKHNIDQFENITPPELYDKIHYKYFSNINYNEVADFIITFSKKLNIHPNDICVLSLSIDTIREIDYYFRDKSKEKSFIMAETEEYYRKYRNLFGETKKFRDELDKIRKNKKFSFWMNSGMVKFSTVHSFKGWEIKTLFLILKKDENEFETNRSELIYTGLTRCMSNLVIINIGDDQLHNFTMNLPIVQQQE